MLSMTSKVPKGGAQDEDFCTSDVSMSAHGRRGVKEVGKDEVRSGVRD